MSVVVTNGAGKYLDTKRGMSRGWTPNLNEAQVFPTVGKAKVGYNYATEYARRRNEHNQMIIDRTGRTDIQLTSVPDFETVEVEVVPVKVTLKVDKPDVFPYMG